MSLNTNFDEAQKVAVNVNGTTTDWNHVNQFVPAGGACPHCGYCPHCGRGGYYTQPFYPYYPYYPNWGITWCSSHQQ